MSEASGTSLAGWQTIVEGVTLAAPYIFFTVDPPYDGQELDVGYGYLNAVDGVDYGRMVVWRDIIYKPGSCPVVPEQVPLSQFTWTLRVNWKQSGLSWIAYY